MGKKLFIYYASLNQNVLDSFFFNFSIDPKKGINRKSSLGRFQDLGI